MADDADDLSQESDDNSCMNSDATEPNYSPDEIEHMLESVGEYLLIAGFEWDLVVQRHMLFHHDQERSGYQLKKKFTKLSNTKMGTGDSPMPDHVHETKEIQHLIIEKWNMAMETNMERNMKSN